ncbi:winged helix-turn-helix transcriptional regulator [Dactylosporangium matsuzakiense]|uniref:HxlR family transcriptional regulator n=1 Tax=Dactylosporangium matsuzakiense TaxID=53360 RepID=A0A9W6KEG8_9ACTN|nr:helix-turn-helix domain-containing protein [Dactylosporangium matsuzakiense]UWZ44428.1 helix-turn-helix transcriptional regulator [Dactylosporangium matsuzakiense]GLK99406.1 HxlR family transcriptional regulator [Dactylosporangium matsuzakiense]
MLDTHTRVPVAEYDACPVTGIVRRIGERWTLVVLSLLSRRRYRFNELHRAIEGISQRMLTRTLRTLESDGLVERTVYPTVPPSVEYALSAKGTALMASLAGLIDWAVAHGGPVAPARR